MRTYLCSCRGRYEAVVLLLVVFLAGCADSQKATVTGKVTLDGKVLDHGSVVFWSGDQEQIKSAAGDITENGTYTVQIGQSGKMYSGEYQVEVSARGPSSPNPYGGPPTPGELITPEHYADTETSGLRYNIRPGNNTIDIVLVTDSQDAQDESAESSPSETDPTEAENGDESSEPETGSSEESSVDAEQDNTQTDNTPSATTAKEEPAGTDVEGL